MPADMQAAASSTRTVVDAANCRGPPALWAGTARSTFEFGPHRVPALFDGLGLDLRNAHRAQISRIRSIRLSSFAQWAVRMSCTALERSLSCRADGWIPMHRRRPYAPFRGSRNHGSGVEGPVCCRTGLWNRPARFRARTPPAGSGPALSLNSMVSGSNPRSLQPRLQTSIVAVP